MNYELKMILEKIKGDFICVYGEERKSFHPKKNLKREKWKETAQFPLSMYRTV